MTIIEKLKEDLKTYMKAKDMVSLNTVRAILNEINIREMKNIKINDEEIIKVLRSEAKKRKESIETFQKAGRTDLTEKEGKELKIIEGYLPAEMSDEELIAKLKEVAASCSDKNFGTVMKAAVSALKGAADGKRISALLKQIL
ncbi:GatB/YqeY domain-containing protein [Candidatus Ruminimicrobium bovinum]|uniref:GatB/YqeY domain-containing protein n=1 Tax=Candidatus Ruminimicrobium bovinum TaxID=3242779 RepID=UPI0039B9587F